MAREEKKREKEGTVVTGRWMATWQHDDPFILILKATRESCRV